MKLDFGREVCGKTAVSESREWLVTNGIGGYASGTINGAASRSYHGLLIAALRKPLGRTLLLAKLDETVEYDGTYPLYNNRWSADLIEPNGHFNLDRFHLEGTTAVFTYAIADALLEKRVWMQPGENTTYIQYTLTRASAPLTLNAKALINYRDHHAITSKNEWQPAITPVRDGLRVQVFAAAAPFFLFAAAADTISPTFVWVEDFYLAIEAYRGESDMDAHIHAADIGKTLQVGDSFTIIASTEAAPLLDGQTAWQQRAAYENDLLDRAKTVWPNGKLPSAVGRLVLAADQFIVERATKLDKNGRSILAGYPWFSDWGRDTMIALPGLTLVTGRPDVAASILRTFAQFVDKGMIPNRFPDEGEEPEYNTVDATLWYFEAIRAYHASTGDDALVRELFPILADIVAWHKKGTRYQIKMDAADHLISAGQDGVQLTWMDAIADGWVVTPRRGKPVEINALWYNALCIMADFADLAGADRRGYDGLKTAVKSGFARFWNAERGYCYDVLDADDPSLRPNQLFAVSLPHSPLNAGQQKAVVDACARHLLTAHGLRSLAADDAQYSGHYGGDRHTRDAAYHQGTVWGWLIGPFVAAHLRVYGDKAQARSYLRPLVRHLADHGVGSLSEVFDGNAPFTARACFAQAWSVAEVLRIRAKI